MRFQALRRVGSADVSVLLSVVELSAVVGSRKVELSVVVELTSGVAELEASGSAVVSAGGNAAQAAGDSSRLMFF